MAEQSINIKIKVDKQGNVELKSLEKGDNARAFATLLAKATKGN